MEAGAADLVIVMAEAAAASEVVPGVEASVTVAAVSAKVAAADMVAKVTEALEVAIEMATPLAVVTEVANVEAVVAAIDLVVAAAAAVFPDLEVEILAAIILTALVTVATDFVADLLDQESTYFGSSIRVLSDTCSYFLSLRIRKVI